MCNSDRRHFLAMGLVAAGAVCVGGAALAAETPKKVYVCPPCGCAADGKEFPEAGACPECGMPLVEKKAEAAPKLSWLGGAGSVELASQDRAPPSLAGGRPAASGRRLRVSRQSGVLS